jgi:hypothetical protein
MAVAQVMRLPTSEIGVGRDQYYYSSISNLYFISI